MTEPMLNVRQPLVSICIPTYNSEKTIKETLESIIKQTYINLRIFVVDNASTDRTLDIAKAIKDKRIQIYSFSENIGGEGNFTRCIDVATGEYTAIYHSDDIYNSDIVAKQVDFLRAYHEAGVVFTEARIIDEDGKTFGRIEFPKSIKYKSQLMCFEKIFKLVLRHSNFFICPSAMVRTEIYKNDIKKWRGDIYKSSADLDVWLRIAQRHKVGVIPLPLMSYRISSTQFSAQVRRQTERADFFRVVDDYMSREEVKIMLKKKDLINYSNLDRRDRVMRAVNLTIVGEALEAKKLLYDLFKIETIKAAFQTVRGAGVFMVGIVLKALISTGKEDFAKPFFGIFKQVFKK